MGACQGGRGEIISTHLHTRGAKGVQSPAGHSLNMTFCKLEWVFNRRLEATSRSCDIICNIRRGPCFESGLCVMIPECAKVEVIGKLGIAEK